MNRRLIWAAFFVMTLLFGNAYGQQSVQIFPTYDCAGEDDSDHHNDGSRGADMVAYICELGDYQVWFGFDLSVIPPGSSITSITFDAYIENEENAERTLWYRIDDSWIGSMTCPDLEPGDELVCTLPVTEGGPRWETFTIDLSAHNWQNDVTDGFISLMLTGPLDGEHICGEVWMRDEPEAPFLTIQLGATIPTLGQWTMGFFLILLCGSAIWMMRRQKAIQ